MNRDDICKMKLFANKYITLLTVFLMLFIETSAGDDFCGIENSTFINGEKITYKVFYNIIGLYVDAGTANFTINREQFNNKPVYHITGEGTSNPSYDWIFKVRDKYESFIDTSTLKPYKFLRNIDEGGYKKTENVSFNHDAGIATSTNKVTKIPFCMQDVLSAIYYARNINYEKYKIGDRIPFAMFIDDEVHNLFIRYMGREVVKTRYGTYNAIKIKPLLIKGTIFEGGEKMSVWISADNNRIPLRIESPISVGSVKVDLLSFQNLRYPFLSKVVSQQQ